MRLRSARRIGKLAAPPIWLRLTLLVIVVAVTCTTLFLKHRRPTSGLFVLSPERGRTAALQACRSFEQVETLVELNDRADRVRSALRESVTHARAAAMHDPAWVPLAGAVQAVQLGIDENDPAAAGLGRDETRRYCDDLDAASAVSPSPSSEESPQPTATP